MNFSKSQIEAMRIVVADLEFIKKEWSAEADDDNLRRFSSTLRQLLIDEGGLIQKVQDWLGTRCYVQASPNPLVQNKVEEVRFYSAGGAEYDGMRIQEMIELSRALSPEEVKRRFGKQTKPPLQKYTMDSYLLAPSIIYEGNVFNRIELIKFIANKLGGAHYEVDPKKMARMKALDEAKDRYQIGGKSSIYFEFLSIGQTISKGKYIDKLKKKIKHTIAIS
ncbi:hypothetical protein A2631_05075 [Candidatus Daviesbacteria bacterium RIFCSPHIGHO2_01_FULL_44_29]|uniref:Uncharacterized protein n=1 Tax=Candidatus Daviesbacteria bacterium RIFCSPHIGHO2_02_FULL_43_12 TaxID=1797776 RepID=A0A1F5KGY3_9BACT|nr:MAG: hypothetical protein A2631_05075 [Candidatus Daviesbacteria bacterium RIFCSPHIGHO2_01_FULL_44_29]OGE40094.1 MAG: hypothetical protein A3D25_04805 [Candidatus Daviesbacteria bacterium RIFCSPHIGHO2_02_FULL_43_12]OGE41042.1 MAG: hypothetical protein A3E86_04900 [Candidatus Daviesbacteria bacterium RIFCSPHIGHO2_12_FULL_47_45]OGE70226.1 MAG: hypothetical protein A3B55_00765 [Candidatus Daviesbacteria bacterium RIFCSPLOWO2_01_FULL_43_15]